MKSALFVFALAACTPTPAPPPAPAPTPDYLKRLTTSGEVQTRGDKGEILPPRADDNEVLRRYTAWKEFGPLEGKAAERLTIMTAKAEYAANEEIRVIHVHEATAPGAELCVMGPKAVYGEWVDGVLKSEKPDVPPLPCASQYLLRRRGRDVRRADDLAREDRSCGALG